MWSGRRPPPTSAIGPWRGFGPRAVAREGRAVPAGPELAGAEVAPTAPTAPTPLSARRPRRPSIGTILPWGVAAAAAIVLAFVAGTLVGGPDRDRLAAQAQQVQGLQRITLATLALSTEPDARRVALAPTDGVGTSGSLLFSPRTTDLVVVAEGLPTPPSGHEYRCWMELDGVRANVGRMFFAGDLAFWVGKTPEVGEAAAGTTFGVSLTEVGGTSLDADPVIAGDL